LRDILRLNAPHDETRARPREFHFSREVPPDIVSSSETFLRGAHIHKGRETSSDNVDATRAQWHIE
jgi:hypothetical protein